MTSPTGNPTMELARPADDGHFVMIPLTHGKFAIVDEGDADLVLAGAPWNATQSGRNNWYAGRSGRRYAQQGMNMHILIAGCRGVDHVNGNGLDNRRVNLRPSTQSQNAANRRLASNNTSGYKGVYRASGTKTVKWIAKIGDKGGYLGTFDDPAEAARAYNRAALEIYGEYARLNPV